MFFRQFMFWCLDFFNLEYWIDRYLILTFCFSLAFMFWQIATFKSRYERNYKFLFLATTRGHFQIQKHTKEHWMWVLRISFNVVYFRCNWMDVLNVIVESNVCMLPISCFRDLILYFPFLFNKILPPLIKEILSVDWHSSISDCL